MAQKYLLSLPPLSARDVVKRFVHIAVGGTERTPLELPATQTGFDATFADNDNVEIFVVDEDDAGNQSTNGKVLSFIAVDDIPPPQPEAPTIVGREEVDDAPPTP